MASAPSSPRPPVPPCCSFQDPRLLDPPCTYSPILNVTLPAGASSAFLRDHPEPGHSRSGLSHDVLPPLRPYTWMPAARAEPPEDLHTTNAALSAPPSPHLCLWLWCQCPVGVVGKRVSIISRVSGFQGPRVKGFQGLNGFRVPKVQGLQGSEG